MLSIINSDSCSWNLVPCALLCSGVSSTSDVVCGPRRSLAFPKDMQQFYCSCVVHPYSDALIFAHHVY